jgi:hypothetical protein
MTIEVVLKIDKEFCVDVDIEDVIDGINDLENVKKWNILCSLINGIDLNYENLHEKQKELIKNYFENKIKSLQNE